MITLEDTVGRNESALTTEVNGDVLLMAGETGNYYGLDKVAGFIWRLLEQPMPVKAICDAVEAGFEVDRRHCEADVFVFLEEMIKNGLVRCTS